MAETVYAVDTPENITLRFERAGLATRAVAFGIDVALMGALLQAVVWSLSAVSAVADVAADVLWILAGFAIQWGYGALSEWRFAGRTLGKHVCGIVVVDASGLQVGFMQAALRNLLRLVDLLPGFHLVGVAVALLDPHNRRLGDLAARTVVIRARSLAAPRPAHAAGAARASNAGAASLPLQKALRSLSSEERAAVLALCDQLEQLTLKERFSLANELASHLTARYGLNPPPTLSAEALLLRIRDALREPGALASVRREAAQES